MKKNSVISFVLTMLLIALNVIPAFSVENMNFSAGYTEYKNDLNKIHFYFTEPIDENDNISFRTIFESEEKEYQYIDSENELENALETMNKYIAKDETIHITVEFNRKDRGRFSVFLFFLLFFVIKKTENRPLSFFSFFFL